MEPYKQSRLARLETRLTVLQVMVGGLYAVIVPMGLLVLRVAAKVGAL
jgi:hypothetical protein